MKLPEPPMSTCKSTNSGHRVPHFIFWATNVDLVIKLINMGINQYKFREE
jgi:hypothetical protein